MDENVRKSVSIYTNSTHKITGAYEGN